MIVTLEDAKLYLRVDSDDENALITNFISSAEEICEGVLRFSLTEFTEVPETVRQAVLYITANLFENRETVDMKQVQEVVTRLLNPYRKEGW